MQQRILDKKLLHSIHLKKAAKPLALCIGILLIVSIIPLLPSGSVQAALTPALHTSGNQILDENNNVVYIRGMGVAGFAPNILFWGPGGSDNWGLQWNYNPITVMDQTFSAMQTQWHLNMIRVFVYPSWYYRDNIVPAQESSSYASSTTPISTRTYLKTLCAEAAKYGIYVNIVPYSLTPYSGSYDRDPYAASASSWQGLPMMSWNSEPQKFLNDIGYGNNEQAFWQWFWTDMANNLKSYPNAIFEAWNEPGWDGSSTEGIPAGYMNYLQTMYSAIRSTGSNNLIMMQWRMGWVPNGWGSTLGWAADINNRIHPTNMVYTTHLYYYAPNDQTAYWAKDYATLKSQVQTALDGMGVVAPLVINEEGSCLAVSSNKQNDVAWWTNLVLVQRDLGIGAGAYYWMSDSGLGPAFVGESLLSGGYSPNAMGQAYINAYNGPPAPTQEPTPTLTPIVTPSPSTQPTTAPTPTSIPTTAPTPTSQPTAVPTSDPSPKPSQTSTPNATPNPTSPSQAHRQNTKHLPTPTPAPTPQTALKLPSTSITVQPNYWSSWYHFGWERFNSLLYWFR